MAIILEKRIIRYAKRESHLPLNSFLNKSVIGKENRYKEEKFIKAAANYNTTSKWIDSHKKEMKYDTMMALKNRAMTQFLAKVSKELDQETIMDLVIYAMDEHNSDLCVTILNFLYKLHKDELMNCFIKKGQKQGETLTQNA